MAHPLPYQVRGPIEQDTPLPCPPLLPLRGTTCNDLIVVSYQTNKRLCGVMFVGWSKHAETNSHYFAPALCCSRPAHGEGRVNEPCARKNCKPHVMPHEITSKIGSPPVTLDFDFYSIQVFFCISWLLWGACVFAGYEATMYGCEQSVRQSWDISADGKVALADYYGAQYDWYSPMCLSGDLTDVSTSIF